MTDVMKAPVGTFCWVELQTSNSDAARSFYSKLFGWKMAGMPPSAGPPYTVAGFSEKRSCAGMMDLPAEAAKMGAPPSWLGYIQVDDVNATTERAAKLGKVLMGPTPMGAGFFSVIQDPTGGVVMPWNTPETMSAFVINEPGAFTWAELLTTDPSAAAAFYSGVFGWKTEPFPGMDYTMFKSGDAMAAGLFPMTSEMRAQGVPTHWAIYFEVGNCDSAVTLAKSLGAQVITPPKDIPTMGRFATLKDPQGAILNVFQSQRR
jgi:predicted enzyme related to lactoylglutathione lyase